MKCIPNLASLLLVVLVCFGCVNKRVAQKEYELLIVTQQIAEPGGSINEDLVTLMLPALAEGCADSLMFPITTLSRIDLGVVVRQEIELKKNWAEQFYGTADDAAKVREKLKTILLAKEFASPNSKLTDAQLADVMKGAEPEGIFVFSNTGKAIQVNGKSLPTSQNTGELHTEIVKYVCASKKSKPTVIVLFDLDYGAATKEEMVVTGMPQDSLAPEMIAVLAEVEEINESATSWKSVYDEIGKHIHTASEHKYGHPEGFTLLVTSARRAIDDGQNMEMFEQMRRDFDNKEEVAKLSRGHHHWEEVAQGLLKRDKEILSHVLGEVYHNWSEILHGKGSLDEHHGEKH